MPHNPSDPYRSVFRSLGIPLLLCCLGVGIILLLEREYRTENHWFGQPKSDFRDIPPEWIAYKQTSIFACPVKGEPTCFALLGDSTFVIGSANPHVLSFFDEKGTLIRKVDLPEEPKAIACGTPDTVLTDKIVIAHPQQIVIYNAEGEHEFVLCELPAKNISQVVISGGMSRVAVHDFHFLSSGFPFFDTGSREKDIRSLVLTVDSLFAADTGNLCIYRFPSDSIEVKTFGQGLPAPLPWMIEEGYFPGFAVYASPITMTFSPSNDLLYITNPGKHRVEVFTPDGVYKPELSWGEASGNLSGFAGCCNPIGLAVLDDGRILTVEKSISRIKIYGTDGELDSAAAGPGILDRMPKDMKQTLKPDRFFAAAVLSEGRIAVFDFDGQLIRIFAPLRTLLKIH